jgi:hypothetical protein
LGQEKKFERGLGDAARFRSQTGKAALGRLKTMFGAYPPVPTSTFCHV